MNIERLTELAEWLERGAPEQKGVTKFDMGDFICLEEYKTHTDMWEKYKEGALDEADSILRRCGTACCIAGAAVMFYSKHPALSRLQYNEADDGRDLLDLTAEQSNRLFFPRNLDLITPSWAARCIRKLIETGEVDWAGTAK